ncbi:hypothetical protein PIB30_042615 [Stylosanthes scabra]|uniref:Uncharacterized protein n=1 Tax=Stylosanthes scabra TaxID=79078 RepID=A0ABU6XDE4_9FABA|nr:hypothetical protein [Stylosanthes scabra]
MSVAESTSRFGLALRLPRRSCAESAAFEALRLNLGSTPVHLGDPVQWVTNPWFSWSIGQLVLTSQCRSTTGHELMLRFTSCTRRLLRNKPKVRIPSPKHKRNRIDSEEQDDRYNLSVASLQA